MADEQAPRIGPQRIGDGSSNATDKKKKKKKKDPLAVRINKFKRGPEISTGQIRDKKLKGQLRHSEKLVAEAAEQAAKAEKWLLPAEAGSLEAEGMERTYRFKQTEIVKEVDVNAARKAFDLTLPQLGPYKVDYDRSGRYLLIGGKKGHLAMMDWSRGSIVTELQVKETTRDVCMLHNETFFAAAQRKYVYIYDKRGLEVHCLREHTAVNTMQFLPHHFLLATVGDPGILIYQDTSTGKMVSEHRTKLGACQVMTQNPWNAVLCCGHHNGAVTLWTPNMSDPVAKVLCNKGPISALACDKEGNYLVTAGLDSQVMVWDIRTYKPLHSYFSATPAVSLDISQRRMLAVAYGPHVQVWKDALTFKASEPYMTHRLPGGCKASGIAFCPYDDVLGVGHSGGIASLLIPGAGEPNFDSFVANPYATNKQRREGEVHQLLDKLPPQMIVVDPDVIGKIKADPKDVQKERKEEQMRAELARRGSQREKNEKKTRMKGKNRASKRFRKKQQNVVDDKKFQYLEEQRKKAKAGKVANSGDALRSGAGGSLAAPENTPFALQRFYKKASEH